MKRIVVIGANGQVASEVCLRLAAHPRVELVPVSRTRNGSAFLRSQGVPVCHSGLSRPEEARSILAGADLVANFALAGGAGRAVVDANNGIISAISAAAPPNARLVFFSTLAANGTWEAGGRRTRNSYGDLKRANERWFHREVSRRGQEGWSLRLGHVLGSYQNIGVQLTAELTTGLVRVPDPDRASNVTHVEAICEALLSIAEGRAAPPMRYDLVNTPQWSWREIYSSLSPEGERTPHMQAVGEEPAKNFDVKTVVFAMIKALNARVVLERLLTALPVRFGAQAQADFMVNRAAGEIAAMSEAGTVSNSASWWPALSVNPLRSARPTADVIASAEFAIASGLSPWPADLKPQV